MTFLQPQNYIYNLCMFGYSINISKHCTFLLKLLDLIVIITKKIYLEQYIENLYYSEFFYSDLFFFPYAYFFNLNSRK